MHATTRTVSSTSLAEPDGRRGISLTPSDRTYLATALDLVNEARILAAVTGADAPLDPNVRALAAFLYEAAECLRAAGITTRSVIELQTGWANR